MNDLNNATTTTINNNILSAIIFTLFCGYCMYHAYNGSSTIECSICGLAAIFHAKAVFHSLSWIRFMKRQQAWITTFKTAYPGEAPKPLTLQIRTIVMTLCPW